MSTLTTASAVYRCRRLITDRENQLEFSLKVTAQHGDTSILGKLWVKNEDVVFMANTLEIKQDWISAILSHQEAGDWCQQRLVNFDKDKKAAETKSVSPSCAT